MLTKFVVQDRRQKLRSDIAPWRGMERRRRLRDRLAIPTTNFSRTVSMTLNGRGISSSVEVTLSPSFDSRADPQQGHCVGAGRTTRSRSMSSGKG